jgi:carbohydrate kinase (thermoresistant glucokinase family)
MMGVAGSGKSTIADALADRLGWAFAEGDELHPEANIAKMAAGHPLTDDERWPWLARVRAWIDERITAAEPGIITCSALKRRYRDVLRDDHVLFVHLTATREQLLPRLATRTGHFMPASMLDSQLADLEPPGPDEQAIVVDADESPDRLVSRLVDLIQNRGAEDSSHETNPV